MHAADRPRTVAILGFWRLSGDWSLRIWLIRAKFRATASVYGTEGQRFESSRARSVAGNSAGLSVDRAPEVKRVRPRILGGPRSRRVVGDEPAGRARGGVEGVVPRGEKDVVALELEGACEMDGVVAAQGVLGGEVAGLKGERFVDRDDA